MFSCNGRCTHIGKHVLTELPTSCVKRTSFSIIDPLIRASFWITIKRGQQESSDVCMCVCGGGGGGELICKGELMCKGPGS